MKYEASGIPAAEAKDEIVRLWDQRAAGDNDAIFRWGYLSSPVGTGQCFLLRATEEGTTSIVGGVGVGIRRVRVAGKTLTAGVLGDFFVLKGHRTFFPALSMQRAALEWSKKNIDVLYGFPNESAQPVIKRLGFKPLADLERHVLVMKHARYLTPRVGSAIAARALAVPLDGIRRFIHPGTAYPAPRGLSLARFDTLDERFDELFESRAFPALAVGVRDKKLLTWRFLEHPAKPSHVYGLVEGETGRLRAYAVVEIVGETANIRDLLGIDIASMTQALRLVADRMRRQGCASLSFLCAAPPTLRSALEGLGFRIRDAAEGPRTMFGHVGENVTHSRVVSALHHWYSTEADEDQ